MRQRTLGIIGAAFLVAGGALGTGTAIYAYRSASTSSPAPIAQQGQFHRPRFGGPQLQPGFGPGGWPGRQREGPGAP